MNPVLIAIIAIAVVLVIYIVSAYNSLVSLKNRVDNGWSQIDTQLQRRYDLIPNLVETVKGYAAHEKETLDQVIKARQGMESANTIHEKAEADNALTGTLKTLFAVAEAYPDLKANQNFMQLQQELTATENKIAFSRQFYNDTVMRFHTALETFPKNIIAGMFNFKQREYFEISNDDAKKNVEVKF